jgi:ketopantoate reductase
MIREHYLEEHRGILEEYKVTSLSIINYFVLKAVQKSLGRISFTSDIWSDPNLTSFMAVTTHFCLRDEAGRLSIASRLLAFRVVEGSHDGEHIGDALFEIMDEAGITHKVCSQCFQIQMCNLIDFCSSGREP